MTALRGNWTPPLYDVLSLQIKNENSLIFVLSLIIFCVAQSVEGNASNLWVLGASLVQVLLFISFVHFYKCIFGENVLDLKNFQYVLEMIF